MQVDRVGASRQLAGVMRGLSVGFFSLARLAGGLGGRARQGEIASARAARMTNAAEEAAIARIVADVKALEAARGGKGSTPGCAKINSCVGPAPPRHRAASRRWRGGRRDDSARRRREFFISAQRFSSSPAKRRIMSSQAKWSRSRTTRASRSKRSRSWPRIAPGPSACRCPCFPSSETVATTRRSAATRVASPLVSTRRSPSTTASRVSATRSRRAPKPSAWSAPSGLWLPVLF